MFYVIHPEYGIILEKDSHILEVLFGATQTDSESVNMMEVKALSQNGKRNMSP